MDLFSELITAVQSDLTIDSSSTLFDPTKVKLSLNRAYNKAAGIFRWPETEDAQKTSSVSGQEDYDYPDNWRPDTAWKLKLNGTDLGDNGDPLMFRDYLYEKENGMPSGLTTMWSSFGRKLFIYPVPTTNGNVNIEIWGQKVVDPLVNDTDTTIFSYSMRECNDAIVMEAVAILKTKGEDTGTSQFLSINAKGILTIAWNKIRQDQQKYQKTTPFFVVPDFFRRRGNSGNTSNGSPIGNF